MTRCPSFLGHVELDGELTIVRCQNHGCTGNHTHLITLGSTERLIEWQIATFPQHPETTGLRLV
jgi:hypothetical protein